MKKSFEFLTAKDWEVLQEKGELADFQKDEIILEEGSRRQVLFVIMKGTARVEQTNLGKGIAIATLEAGEMFGEMSFLEGVPASASVIAEEPVQVLVLKSLILQPLLQSVPGLAIRFYQSLTITLSRRLRETSAMLPNLMLEEVPQVKPPHSEHPCRLDEDRIPPSLIKAVNEYKTAMIGLDRAIAKEKGNSENFQSEVSKSCTAMLNALTSHIERESQLAESIGGFVLRETFPFFMASHFIDRCFTKPRGYAGDYKTIEFIYDKKPLGHGRLGPFVDFWSLELKASKAVRERRHTISSLIYELTKNVNGDNQIPITSLACGPAKEVFDILLKPNAPDVQFTCVDIDPVALESVAEKVNANKLGQKIRLHKENIVRMALGKGKTRIPPQAMIYSTGLIDYLQDRLVVAMMDWSFDHLQPGGKLVLGNFNKGNPDKTFMDYIGEWVLIHRSPDDLRELFSRSKFGNRTVTVDQDETSIQLFAICQKT
jgi:extracellular factor (EF) 3-hydroxypalmitic acid methyl ester biosynthesis protein